MKQVEDKITYLRLVSDNREITTSPEGEGYFFDEYEFNKLLNREKKRSQRAKKPLLLMNLDISGMIMPHFADEYSILLKALSTCTRETDIQGWCERESVIGILFTEIASASPSVRESLLRRVMAQLVGGLGPSILYRIKVTFHVYAEGKIYNEAVDREDLRCHNHLAKKKSIFNLSAKIKSLVDEASNFLLY